MQFTHSSPSPAVKYLHIFQLPLDSIGSNDSKKVSITQIDQWVPEVGSCVSVHQASMLLTPHSCSRNTLRGAQITGRSEGQRDSRIINENSRICFISSFEQWQPERRLYCPSRRHCKWYLRTLRRKIVILSRIE